MGYVSKGLRGAGKEIGGPVGYFLEKGGDLANLFGLAHAMNGPRRKPKAKKGKPKRSGPGKNAKKKAARRALGPAYAGNTAGAGSAPLNFARTRQLKPFFRMLPSDRPEGCIVHTVDFVGALGSYNGTTAGAWQGQSLFPLTVTAGSPWLHPWLSNIAKQFMKWRIRMFKIHYEHFCAATTAGQVVLQFFPDPEYNNGATNTLTQAQSQNAGNYMSGACDEDFSLTADLSAVDTKRWRVTESTLATNDDVDDHDAGVICVYTANGALSQPSTGNLWVEAVYELNGRKTSDITVGLTKAREVLENQELKPEEKKEFLHRAVDQLVERTSKKPPVQENRCAAEVRKALRAPNTAPALSF